MKHQLFLIHGNKGVGKTTLANQLTVVLQENGYNVKRLSFAADLKEIFADIIDKINNTVWRVRENVDYISFVDDEDLVKLLFTHGCIDYSGKDLLNDPDLKEERIFNGDLRPRDFMIEGSENFIKKFYGKYIWSIMLMDKIIMELKVDENTIFIIDDFRIAKYEELVGRVFYDLNPVHIFLSGDSCFEQNDEYQLNRSDFDAVDVEKINNEFVYKFLPECGIVENFIEDFI